MARDRLLNRVYCLIDVSRLSSELARIDRFTGRLKEQAFNWPCALRTELINEPQIELIDPLHAATCGDFRQQLC